MTSNETYMFMSQPRAVDAARKKYRDPMEDEEGFDNTASLMYDPRVIRGITCTGPDVNKTQIMEEKENDSSYNYALKKEQLLAAGKIRPTHDTVAQIHEKIVVPKVRVEVPLHLYLIEQEVTIPKTDADTQTDTFLEEEPEPNYIPKKTGVDMETQVENEEVFDYDIDVMPILQVVISKTIEQSLMEVRQEEQLRTVSRKREHLEEKARIRADEAAKLERDERAALRLKNQMLLESRQRHAREVNMQKKLASNVFAARYLANLQATVFDDLDNDNYFYSPVQLKVEQFAPWLRAKIGDNLQGVEEGQKMTDTLIKQTIARIREEQRKLIEKKAAEAAALEAARVEAERLALLAAARAKEVQLYIHTDLVDEPVGPITLTGNSTVSEIQAKILEWMAENTESPPNPEYLSFVYKGSTLSADSVLYDIGMEMLATIQMIVNVPKEEEGGEGDENEEEED